MNQRDASAEALSLSIHRTDPECGGTDLMKKIYIDITNIPGLAHYTGISRVVSETVLRLVRDNADIVLLSYNPCDHAYRVADSRKLAGYIENMTADKRDCITDELITPEQFERNSVFLELNSCWHTLPNRSWMLPVLKNRGIRIVTQIYDIIPVRYPQYMASHTLLKFMEFLTAHLTYADDIIVNTEAVREDVLRLFSELDMQPKPVHVIGLGADFTADSSSADESADETLLRKLEGRKFLLTVGTVEPRKNHRVLVDAYEKRIASLDTDVVIVGRTGWQMEEFMDRIRSDKRYGNGLYVLSDVNDATLAELYRMAWMVVFPSYTEGFGLPTIEALINGIPVICSDIPVMREVGGRFCDYFPADDSTALANIVENYISHPEKYSIRKTLIAEEYTPPSWKDTVRELTSLLESEKISAGFEHHGIRQIVFLSARPEPLLDTLPYVEEFMPFITELVVFCPDRMAEFMRENYSGRLRLTLVTDDELLAGAALPADHSTRNFFLRCLAMRLDILDDEFIMSDDDYRPLGPVSEEFFFRDGKYRGYYFSDISTWKYRISSLFSYDYCHFRTLEFLKKNGYPTLQYSSHQPQVINRRWYLELLDRYPEIKTLGYDEWSTYFNYCAVHHSDRYTAVPYTTLSWPNIGGENYGVSQSEYAFENFYSENYHMKGLFRKYTEKFTDAQTVVSENEEKVNLALTLRKKFDTGRRRREEFSREYESREHVYPQFAVYFHGGKDTAPVIGGPDYYRLSSETLNVIDIGVSRESRCAMNIMNAEFTFVVSDQSGRVLSAGTRVIHPRTEYTHISFSLPSAAPGPCTLKTTVTIPLTSVSSEKTIPAEII